MAAMLLQLAYSLLAAVNNNPNIPGPTQVQAVNLANQTIQYVNQNSAYLQQPMPSAAAPYCYINGVYTQSWQCGTNSYNYYNGSNNYNGYNGYNYQYQCQQYGYPYQQYGQCACPYADPGLYPYGNQYNYGQYQYCNYNYGYNGYNGYNYPTTYPTTQLQVLNSGNVDTSMVRNGQTYTVLWSPFNGTLGQATVELVNSSGVIIQLGRTNANTLPWVVAVGQGTYTLRISQNGNILITRTVTVQQG